MIWPKLITVKFMRIQPIPVAVRSKAWVCGLLLVGCGFESRRRHGCLSAVNVVSCQVEVSETNRPLVQRSRNECGASLCVIRNLVNVGALAHWGLSRQKQTN
jgi:hypothetical protein